MLQTLLNDKLWLKIKPILLDLNIYDKPNLRNIFTGNLYRLKTGCQWQYLPECFENIIPFLKLLEDGKNWINSPKFLNSLLKILIWSGYLLMELIFERIKVVLG